MRENLLNSKHNWKQTSQDKLLRRQTPLRLPQLLIDLSPVGQTTVPTDVPVGALAVMVAVAALITLLAGSVYRRRDAA